MSARTGHEVSRVRGYEVRRGSPRNLVTSRPRDLLLALITLFLSLPALAQTTRIASDFEIQQMEQQAAREHDFTAQFQAHMNLGDSRSARNEMALAKSEYRQAAEIAEGERIDARRASDMRRYANATVSAALAYSKLDNAPAAFERLEEGIRYESDDAKIWNMYASAMNELRLPSKAAAAARNAVAIEEVEAGSSPSAANLIDLGIYRYSLALALSATAKNAEAEELLRQVIASLRSKEFDRIRREVAQRESFEVYSTVRGEASAYLSLLNRAQLRLAEIYEKENNVAAARKVYRDMLHDRTDEPNALAALARLSRSAPESAAAYADAFDANPFSISLIRDYEQWLAKNATKPNDGATDGARVRRALEQRAAGENVAVRDTLDALAKKFPQNDVVQYLAARNDIEIGDLARARNRKIGVPELRDEIASRLATANAVPPPFLASDEPAVNPTTAELRQLMAVMSQQRLTPEQRVRLDKLAFTSTARFDSAAVNNGQTTLETGSIDGIAFRFSQPTAFAGTFAANVPLVLTYRVLGVTDLNGATAFLLEPVKVDGAR